MVCIVCSGLSLFNFIKAKVQWLFIRHWLQDTQQFLGWVFYKHSQSTHNIEWAVNKYFLNGRINVARLLGCQTRQHFGFWQLNKWENICRSIFFNYRVLLEISATVIKSHSTVLHYWMAPLLRWHFRNYIMSVLSSSWLQWLALEQIVCRSWGFVVLTEGCKGFAVEGMEVRVWPQARN